MADITITETFQSIHRVLPKPRLPRPSIASRIAALILAYAKAVSLLYLPPFGLDAHPQTRPDTPAEDGRDPRW